MHRAILRCSWRRRVAIRPRSIWIAARCAPCRWRGGQAQRADRSARAQAGAPLMTVVPVQRIYVDANFKEGPAGQQSNGPAARAAAVRSAASDGSTAALVVGFSAVGSAFAAIPRAERHGQLDQGGAAPARGAFSLDAAELAGTAARGLSMAGDGRSAAALPTQPAWRPRPRAVSGLMSDHNGRGCSGRCACPPMAAGMVPLTGAMLWLYGPGAGSGQLHVRAGHDGGQCSGCPALKVGKSLGDHQPGTWSSPATWWSGPSPCR